MPATERSWGPDRRLHAACLAAVLIAVVGCGPEAPPAWLPLEQAVAEAEASGKKLLVDVYAPDCRWCALLHEDVYTDDDVRAYLDDHYVLTRLDIENDRDTLRFRGLRLTPMALAYGFGAEGTPTTVFLTSDAAYITRLPGYVETPDFTLVLRYVGSDAWRAQSFDDYADARR